MSYKFEMYIGPSGAGKSSALAKNLLTEAHNNPNKNYILVVPDQSASSFEKRLIAMNDELFGIPGLLNVDITGMSRLAYRILSEFDVPGTEVIEEYERNMMVRAAASRVAKDLLVYGKSIDKKGFISQAKSLITEFIQYGITSEDIEMLEEELKNSGQESLREKLHDIGLIYQDMREHYYNGSGFSGEEKMKVAAQCLSGPGESITVDKSIIAFDEFRGFTPDQLLVINTLKLRVEKLIFSITIDTDIVKTKTEVKEHELYYQSYLTIEALKELLGENPVYKFYERGSVLSRFEKGTGLEHLEQGLFRFPIKEYKGELSDIELWRTDDQMSEISVVAEDIIKKVREGARYKDFAIVSGDINSLSAYADNAFQNYGIPVFMDTTRSIGKNPYTEGLIKLTQIIDKDFSYETVFGFIKLGLMSEEISGCVDVLENYALRHGIRGRKRWETPFVIPEGKIKSEIDDEIREDIRRAEESRAAIMKLLAPMTEPDKKNSTVKTICAALRQMMDKDHLDYERRISETAELYNSLGRYSEAHAMEQLYEKLSDIIGSMEELLGSEVTDIHSFSEILATGTEDLTLGVIPPTLDAVIVADSGRSRIGTVKTLYFINMNDGIIPTPRKDGRILTDRDKDCIQQILMNRGIRKSLAPNDRLESYMEQFYIYQMMTRPSEKLIITYSDTSRDGKPMEISYIAGRVKRMFPMLRTERKTPVMFNGTIDTDIYGFTDSLRKTVDILKNRSYAADTDDEKLQSDYHNIALFSELSGKEFKDYDDALFYRNEACDIPQDIMKNLQLEISVSKIETYAECPYMYFMEYILRLEKREEKVFDYADAGNIVHKSLEIICSEIKEKHNNEWSSLSDVELAELSEKALHTAAVECEKIEESGEEENGKTKVIMDKFRDLIYRTADTLKYQLTKGSLLPEAFEQRFRASFKAERPSGDKVEITINGFIDRLDVLENDDGFFFRIIDYKTGDQKFSPGHIIQGTDLQLTVYMDIIREVLKSEYKDKKVIPAGLYYYHVSNPDISNITKSALQAVEGDEEKAAVIEQRKALRLRGAVNDDDVEKHEYLKLQDKDLIKDDGSIGNSTVMMVSPAGKNSPMLYTARTAAVGTEAMESMGTFGRSRMLEITEDILAGKIDKHPIRYDTDRNKKCAICDYKDICRFSVYSGKVNYVSGSAESDIEKIKGMKAKVAKEVKYDKVERITTGGSGKPE
jgi:ATP-dependent nuclease, subunit B